MLDALLRFDCWFLRGMSDNLADLHEWLDLTKADVVKLLQIPKFLILAIPLQLQGSTGDWLNGAVHFFLCAAWLAICTMGWLSAEQLSAHPRYSVPSRILAWTFLVGAPFIPLLGILFVERSVLDCPDQPSKRGRKRKELLAKLHLRKFEPAT
jgi:hypothetical protein